MDELTVSWRVKAEYSFKDLAEQIHNGTSGLKVGDEVSFKLVNGSDATAIVMDDETFGEGHMAFKFKDAIFNEDRSIDENNHLNGFYESKMNNETLPAAFRLLPAGLRDVITERAIIEKCRDGTERQYKTPLWLLSATEVRAQCDNDVGNVTLKLFKDVFNRISRNGVGYPCWYWLRSAHYSGSTNFYNVYTYGSVGSNSASNAFAVVPCFLI